MIISKLGLVPRQIKQYFRYTPYSGTLVSDYVKFARDSFTNEQVVKKMQEQLATGVKPSKTMKKMQRVADITTAGILFIPCMTVSSICGIAQKIAHPKSPIFFRQERIGLNGKPFFALKIPTLEYTDKNERLSSGFSRFLRKHSIDEFPQIINVLKGDMSIFGPRAIRRKEMTEAVNAVGGEFLERYNFLPGFGYGSVIEKESPIARRNIEKAIFRHFTPTEYFKTMCKLAKSVVTGSNK